MLLDNNTSIFMYLLLFLSLFSIIFIIWIAPRLTTKKIKNKNEHGSSKFADNKEIKKTFRKEKLNSISDAGGFPVYYEKLNNKYENVYFDDASPHWTLIGSTGAGKSSCVVINECIMFATSKKKRSVIVTDPKGEIFTKTSSIFKNNGYNILTIDFRNPNLSNRINIMQPIIDEWKLHCSNHKKFYICCCYLFHKLKIDYDKFVSDENYRNDIKNANKIDNYIMDFLINNVDSINDYLENIDNSKDKELFLSDFKDIKNLSLYQYFNNMNLSKLLNYIKIFQNDSVSHQAETIRLTNSLANLIFVDKDTKDVFWINSSKSLFKGICGIFLEDYQKGYITEDKITISSIKKFQNSSLSKENQLYLQRNLNNRDYGTLSKDYLTSILSSSENTYKSIVSVFSEKMQIFDDINVENITSKSEFEFTSIAKEPTVLYLVVPDEDRSYYQLVTIIIGIIYKDLTKFANLPENKGKLPRPIEWILDEFCNSPPLDSIETLISVARSRLMFFQLFIQSFAQLDQVYGKDTASIILDNTSLCYLKTNSIDCADRVSKMLGKSTIETSSISQSTDQFKIGANKTTSLLGRELLTANEIIGLKHKTIIFPTNSNPIFRDSILYSDIFPDYKDIPPVERDIKIIKKTTENYYTVEQLKVCYENALENDIKEAYQNYDDENNNNDIEEFIDNIKEAINVKKTSFFNGNFTVEIDKQISKYEENKIINLLTPYITFEMFINSNGTTTLTIWREVDFNREK